MPQIWIHALRLCLGENQRLVVQFKKSGPIVLLKCGPDSDWNTMVGDEFRFIVVTLTRPCAADPEVWNTLTSCQDSGFDFLHDACVAQDSWRSVQTALGHRQSDISMDAPYSDNLMITHHHFPAIQVRAASILGFAKASLFGVKPTMAPTTTTPPPTPSQTEMTCSGYKTAAESALNQALKDMADELKKMGRALDAFAKNQNTTSVERRSVLCSVHHTHTGCNQPRARKTKCKSKN